MFNPDFKLLIETGNSAFSQNPEKEVARILRELATAVENDGLHQATFRIRDVNGNTVGEATYKP
jgi:hypothetical protein